MDGSSSGQSGPGDAAQPVSTPVATPVKPSAAATTVPVGDLEQLETAEEAANAMSPGPTPDGVKAAVGGTCRPYIDTQMYRKTNFTDTYNTTVAISPKRPSADRAAGQWIPGRATFYGASAAFEAAHVACGEPAGQYGVLEHGSCGYTNSDGSLVYPKEVYAAAADANMDYPGSCGRCYQVRCKSGEVENNGRSLRISDLVYGRIYPFLRDDFGRLPP
eukprot:gene770-1081_t